MADFEKTPSDRDCMPAPGNNYKQFDRTGNYG
jgi:hypothetical protein